MAEEKDDLEKFLNNVDEISAIIKNLSSGDEEKNSQAMKASENFMKVKENIRTKFDKSSITGESKSSPEQQQANEQEQFLKGMELDAKERARKRKRNEADADLLKSKGNKEFKSGCYQEAIKCYTEAIKLVKYIPALYTNRAQAYIKLENYDAAIDDCNWAIKIDEKCVKAYVHYGRALQKKTCFSEAISFFKKAEEIDPKHKNIIADYISQTKNEQLKYDFERKVIMEQERIPGLKEVGEMIKDFGENKGNFKECVACAKNLGNLLENSDDSKTLFRLLKGFDYFGKNTEFRRLCENPSTWNSADQEKFVCEILNIGKIATADNEYNVEEFLNHDVIRVIHNLCHKCDVEKVHLAAVNLLHQLTEFTLAREHILNYVQHNRCFLDELFKFLDKRDTISRVVMGCINNLSLNETFASEHFERLEYITLSVLETSSINDGHNVDDTAQVALVSSSFATLANLVRVKKIRNKLQCNDQLWKVCVNVLTRYVEEVDRREIGDMIYAELGLLVNLSSDDSTCLKNHAISVAPFLLKLLSSGNSDLVKRGFGALRLLMTYSEEVVKLSCAQSSYEVFMDIIKRSFDDSTISYGVKCLALCSAKNTDAKTYISENGVAVFQSLLSSSNETIVGNSALILSYCFEQDKACDQLAGTSIVKDLLSLATRDDLSDEIKQNVAIALAKLVKRDLRFLEQLRELHGLEILHSVIQRNGLL